MGVAMFFLIIGAIVALVLLLAVGLPAVVGYLSSRDAEWKKRYLTERKNKNILYTAHREILSQNGDGAALISEIAIRDVDSNELKELN